MQAFIVQYKYSDTDNWQNDVVCLSMTVAQQYVDQQTERAKMFSLSRGKPKYRIDTFTVLEKV